MVERIKALCSGNNTSIKALEKELGFGNGTIRRWDKNAPSVERIAMVANRFNVSMAYIMGDTDDPTDKSLTHWADLHYGSNPKREDFEVGADGFPVHIGNKKSPTPEGVERIPGYSDLNSANQAIIDNLIAQLLAAQSDD